MSNQDEIKERLQAIYEACRELRSKERVLIAEFEKELEKCEDIKGLQYSRDVAYEEGESLDPKHPLSGIIYSIAHNLRGRIGDPVHGYAEPLEFWLPSNC